MQGNGMLHKVTYNGLGLGVVGEIRALQPNLALR